MKKPFLLIAGEHDYPSSGIYDWVGTFESYESALLSVPKGSDWFKIVDLREWTE